MTSDQLVGAEVVLADGRILACDDQHDTDLFWALRGAGALLGIATSLVFEPVPSGSSRSPLHSRCVWPSKDALE